MKSKKQLRAIFEKALMDTLTRLKLPKSSKKIRKAAAKAASRLTDPVRKELKKELRKVEKQVTAGRKKIKKKAVAIASTIRRRVR